MKIQNKTLWFSAVDHPVHVQSQFFIMKLRTYKIRVEVATYSPYGAKKRQIKLGEGGVKFQKIMGDLRSLTCNATRNQREKK